MTLGAIQAGDVVKVDIRGRQFYAKVDGKEEGILAISPLTRGISYRHAEARSVVEHYRRMGRPRPTRRGAAA